LIATAGTEVSDADLVAAVRTGDDRAFEELYRRYFPRISAFVCRMLHDAAGCEDVAQEAFLSALRRMRANDAEINFKPWIYQIARNAAIDAHRRRSHAVEVSMDADDGLRASDRTRLVGLDGGPDAALITKERLDHLQGAFDELSDVHTRVLVMRELEGMSYREIGKRLHLTRPAVESALFRARRRLETEYTELAEGRRCEAMRQTMMRIAAGTHKGAEEHRLARHAKRCHTCRKHAREMGIEPLTTLETLRRKAAALLPIPWLFRRAGGDGGWFTGLFSTGANSAPLAERAAALVAAAALVGAGGAALGTGALRHDRATAGEDRLAAPVRSTTGQGESRRGTAGHATDGERAGARRASGRRTGPAGSRAGGSGDGVKQAPAGAASPAGGSGGAAGGRAGAGAGGSVPSVPGGSLPSVPDTPQAPTTPQTPSVQTPPVHVDTPRVGVPPSGPLPGAELPPVHVEVPPVQVQVPDTRDVTDGVTDGVNNLLH
jgi:RNA polymerase sigma factor (sigma-70 family)